MQTFLRWLSRIVMVLAIIGLIFIVFVYYFVFGIHLKRETALGSDGKMRNATWLAHEWVGEPHDRQTIHGLVTSLTEHRITDVFLHAGPIESDGSVPSERYVYAKEFLKIAHELAPEIKLHAWLGQKRENLPLENPVVRGRIVAEARKLIEETGFDGIHLNIEPMQSDPYVLKLITEMRDGLGGGGAATLRYAVSATISPVVPKYYKSFLQKFFKATHFLGYDLSRNYNDMDFIKELAEELDLVVLMAYDTGFRDASLYQWFIEQEMIYLSKAAPAKVMIGLPTYEDEKPNFDPRVENLAEALAGISLGLQNIRVNKENLAGLAIYAAWTTDAEEWRTWDTEWLNQ